MEKVSVICPSCKKLLCKTTKDNKMHKLVCRNCWKWIWFNPTTNETSVHKKPDRQTSSGVRFY